MDCYIGINGYYEGDRQSADDIAVERRPTQYHVYSDGWVFSRDKWLEECIRPQRNVKLAICDWTMLPDAPLSSDQKLAWQTYRQMLRDLPQSAQHSGFCWPQEPA